MKKNKPVFFFDQYHTSDNLILPLLHCKTTRADRALIWLHGMGSSGNFYVPDRINALAEEMQKIGIALIAPNNRGAGIAQRLKFIDSEGELQRVTIGTSHEMIHEAIHDISGIADYARRAGYRQVYLAGHSSGANKIAVYNFHEKNNPFAGYVLFGGGDDTGLHIAQLGRFRHRWLMRRCKAQLRRGHGGHLIPRKWKLGWFSYQSLLDILDPNGEYNTFPFWEARKGALSRRNIWRFWQALHKPTLVIYGEQDEYCQPNVRECIKLLKKNQVPGMDVEYKVVSDADHGASGREKELARAIASWLSGQKKRAK